MGRVVGERREDNVRAIVYEKAFGLKLSGHEVYSGKCAVTLIETKFIDYKCLHMRLSPGKQAKSLRRPPAQVPWK